MVKHAKQNEFSLAQSNAREVTFAGSVALQNDGSRSLDLLGGLVSEGARLMPGQTLELVAERAMEPIRITLFDGGLQIDCGSQGHPQTFAYGAASS